MLRALILGMDGYIGWSLALHLADQGNYVVGLDNFSRRKNVDEVGSQSAIPIQTMELRMHRAKEKYGNNLHFHPGDLTSYKFISDVIRLSKPDLVVHLGQQPSAPYSMIDAEHACYTQTNNVIGTLNLLFAMRDNAPEAHLIKLGTMGEYGTPDLDIPEGFFDVEYKGKKSRVMFPRQPGSYYHASKVHDSHNIMLASRIWGLRCTDIMQGVVYGTRTHEVNPLEYPDTATRFDFDEFFGTAINRYCAQAVVSHPLTVYGKGSQRRGFLALIDSIQCLALLSENPPKRGEYRVVNQIDEVYSLSGLAEKVRKVGAKRGLPVKINHVENPRIEAEEHHYVVESTYLRKLGFRPTRRLEGELDLMLEDLMPFKDRIIEKSSAIRPRTTWEKGRVNPPTAAMSQQIEN
jgi:UDP-sulfoquinovose synthase